jgi:hypothetical protein
MKNLFDYLTEKESHDHNEPRIPRVLQFRPKQSPKTGSLFDQLEHSASPPAQRPNKHEAS